MGDSTQFTIGAEARCTDEDCGEVSRVIVDPVARVVTHLVVEQKVLRGPARLVPLNLVEVDAATGDVRLKCKLAEFDKLDAAEEAQFLQPRSGFAGYGAGQALFFPYYSLGLGAMGVGMIGGNSQLPITQDMVPKGEIEVHRGDQVSATDGEIGRVQGLVIDPRDHHITHVLLQEGHLWGSKEVAIPISSVTGVDSGIQLDLTKQQVKDLPAVEVDQFIS